MTDRVARAARNQQNSVAAFLAKEDEFGGLLAELQQASEDHFGADRRRCSGARRPGSMTRPRS